MQLLQPVRVANQGANGFLQLDSSSFQGQKVQLSKRKGLLKPISHLIGFSNQITRSFQGWGASIPRNAVANQGANGCLQLDSSSFQGQKVQLSKRKGLLKPISHLIGFCNSTTCESGSQMQIVPSNDGCWNRFVRRCRNLANYHAFALFFFFIITKWLIINN